MERSASVRKDEDDKIDDRKPAARDSPEPKQAPSSNDDTYTDLGSPLPYKPTSKGPEVQSPALRPHEADVPYDVDTLEGIPTPVRVDAADAYRAPVQHNPLDVDNFYAPPAASPRDTRGRVVYASERAYEAEAADDDEEKPSQPDQP
ncbi:hypothetical protein ACHAXT_013150 [Thalassiosira profunda]